MSEEKMQNSGTTLSLSIQVASRPTDAFVTFIDELSTALSQEGIIFETGPNGRVVEGEMEVGRVLSWQPGKHILLQWRQANWNPGEITEVEIRFEEYDDGTRLTLEHRGWGRLIGDPNELTGWFAGEAAAHFLRVTAPAAFGDWITDRRARRPSGAQSRAIYRAPLYHYPNFRVILAELALTPGDNLIEVGCGGGAFLNEALRSGCRAAGIDHSPDMVRQAIETNHQAVAEGRLEVRQASADRLPFSDATFTSAVMTGILGFLPDPVAALREIRRVLRAAGRLVMLGSDPELRGTPAAPEPMASRLRFYDDDQLLELARQAGFDQAHVVRRDLEPFAREAGIPQEHLGLFAGPGARFLIARTD